MGKLEEFNVDFMSGWELLEPKYGEVSFSKNIDTSKIDKRSRYKVWFREYDIPLHDQSYLSGETMLYVEHFEEMAPAYKDMEREITMLKICLERYRLEEPNNYEYERENQ